jgi:hypothetical protein
MDPRYFGAVNHRRQIRPMAAAGLGRAGAGPIVCECYPEMRQAEYLAAVSYIKNSRYRKIFRFVSALCAGVFNSKGSIKGIYCGAAGLRVRGTGRYAHEEWSDGNCHDRCCVREQFASFCFRPKRRGRSQKTKRSGRRGEAGLACCARKKGSGSLYLSCANRTSRANRTHQFSFASRTPQLPWICLVCAERAKIIGRCVKH